MKTKAEKAQYKKEWLSKRGKPHIVAGTSVWIGEAMIKQCEAMPKVVHACGERTASLTHWLTARVNEFDRERAEKGDDRMRMVVARVLKGYEPGALRPHGTQFQNTAPGMWLRFSFQARVMSVKQAELLAYFVLTQGEKR